MNAAKQTAIDTLNTLADEYFGADPDRYYWTHCTVNNDGAVYIGKIKVGSIGTLSTPQVQAVKPELDEHNARRARWG